MTESEWLECTDPTPMLEFLRNKASDRKLRLFIASYCRHHWHLFDDECYRQAIEVAELFADGQVGETELSLAYIETSQIWTSILSVMRNHDWQSVPVPIAHCIADTCRRAVRPRITPRVMGLAAEGLVMVLTNGVPDDSLQGAESQVQVKLLRKIVGNPFRPVAINPVWLTPTVLNLAQSAYEDRILPSGELDPARLAVLSDALEEVGCDNDDIHAHLRSPGPHVRSCWAVDLILRKE